MGEARYLTEAYCRSLTTTVVGHRPEGTMLEDTVFHPTGGGQPSDTGALREASGAARRVLEVTDSPEGAVHRVEGPPLAIGSPVTAELDWPRRYAHMRLHTVLHLLSGVVFERFGVGITGGQIYPDRARMDFSMPELGRRVAEELVEELNRVAARDLPVTVRFVPRSELDSHPSLVRVARELLPAVERIRLIDIGGFDVQADGGTHVRSTAEVGRARLERIENKGARNKRLYLSLDPPASAAPPP